jgi:hypothetical protein
VHHYSDYHIDNLDSIHSSLEGKHKNYEGIYTAHRSTLPAGTEFQVIAVFRFDRAVFEA